MVSSRIPVSSLFLVFIIIGVNMTAGLGGDAARWGVNDHCWLCRYCFGRRGGPRLSSLRDDWGSSSGSGWGFGVASEGGVVAGGGGGGVGGYGSGFGAAVGVLSNVRGEAGSGWRDWMPGNHGGLVDFPERQEEGGHANVIDVGIQVEVGSEDDENRLGGEGMVDSYSP